MRNKLMFIAGAGIGYVLGARAGRKSYEQIAAKASALWHDEKVQKTVSDVESFVKDKAPIVQQKISETTKGAVGKVRGKAQGGSGATGDTSTPPAHSAAINDQV